MVALLLAACQSHPKKAVTLTFLDLEWSHNVKELNPLYDAAAKEFTQQTGTQIIGLPGPETATAQLALAEELLQKRASSPDLYGVDVIWPGMVKDHMVDLSGYFPAEVSAGDPAVVANYSINGKLVAVPYHANVGVLYYRADLLHKYGFEHPPRSWDELEKMALHIQGGERASGNKEFWGFVWAGASSEGLTCEALEWQAAEGGGSIIESDKTISVNNAAAIRSWERAKGWIGRISPPDVVLYKEWDAVNSFWNSGRAAFLINWGSDYFINHHHMRRAPIGITSVPGANGRRVATLGGFGLGISESSLHRAEAVEFIRFLLRKEALGADVDLPIDNSSGEGELFELPLVLKAYPQARKPGQKEGASVVVRPSTVTGDKYDDVSRAYATAVHSVLTGEAKAPAAAANLEKQLSKITGFRTGPPRQIF